MPVAGDEDKAETACGVFAADRAKMIATAKAAQCSCLTECTGRRKLANALKICL
jgi:hypothetical protein